MMDAKVLFDNSHKIHTTELGNRRIKRNLNLKDCDSVEYCKNKLYSKNILIERIGKNWYISDRECIITINASSYTIITAHPNKKK